MAYQEYPKHVYVDGDIEKESIVVKNFEAEYAANLRGYKALANSHPPDTPEQTAVAAQGEYLEYPKMLYKAHTRPDGKRSVGEVNDRLFAERGPEGQLLVVAGAAEQWTRRCQMTVKDDYEKQRAYEGGWRDTPQAALDFLEERDHAIERATAERHAADARMSPQAQAEAAAVDLSTLRQVPVIPEKPARRKPGPKPKAQPATE